MIKPNYLSFLLILALLAFSFKSQAQSQQLTIYPDKDAMVNSKFNNRNVNFGTNTLFDASAWTVKGGFYNERSLMQFDVSSIPSNAVIDNATLYLYGNGHFQNTEEGNRCFIKLLTSEWDENFVTWNNQPRTSLDSLQKLIINDTIINVPSSISANQNYTIDIKKFLEYWVQGKIENLGLQLKLQNENLTYNTLSFCSSDYYDANLHPKVVITYHLENNQDITFTQNKNWVRTITYLENGEVASDNVVFADNFGKTSQIQQQLKNSDNTTYLVVNQVIYDASGRPVLTTLPAATNVSYGGYISDFITPGDNPSKEYNYADFNTFSNSEGNNPGDVNNPKPVSTSSVLGNYYSNSNTMESFVGTTSFPYNSAFYGVHQKEKVNKIAMAGDVLHMGTGKEKKSYKVYAAPNELFGSDCGSGADAEFPVPAYKIVNTDNNGNVTVEYYNADDQLIATCEPDASRAPYLVTGKILMPGYIDIQLPAGMPMSEQYHVKCYRIGPDPVVTHFNLEKKEDPGGTQFYSGVADINFQLAYNGPGYYRINATTENPVYYRLAVEYYLNYSNWKLYKNDKAGRLIENVAGGSSYYYNSMGLLTSETNIDRGTTRYYYYDDGKLHFKVTNNQNDLLSLTYINYDDLGRPVETGEKIFANSTLFDQEIQNFVNLPTTKLVGGNKDVYQTMYDIADIDFYTITGLSSSDYKQTNLLGRVSKTSNENTTTWYSYDMQGRVIWTVEKINGLGVKTIDYVYNWRGLLVKTEYQKNTQTERFDHVMIYDNNVRLAEIKTFAYSGNSSIYKSQAKYYYYKHGPLKRIELADNLQGMDYVYTVNGWLKSINNPTLVGSIDPGLDGQSGNHANFKTDIFGMTLDYFNGDYQRNNSNILPLNTTNNYYNGNVKAMRWKTNNDIININNNQLIPGANQVIYKFDYDSQDRLTSAIFGGGSPGSNSVNFTPTVKENYNMAITYDSNGNIQTLVRNAYTYDSNGSSAMDNLVYHYVYPKLNRLKYVSDNFTDNNKYTTDINSGQTSGNYEYNSNGQLTANVQEGLYYTYNHLGLVTAVHTSPSRNESTLKASYLYDDRGHRLKKTVINGTTTTVTWYINDVNGNELCIQTVPNQGEIGSDYLIYGLNRIGNYNNASGQYTYNISDHLGNVRAVIKKSSTGGVEFVSATDYYPWGMEMPGRMFNSDINRYGYQGEYSEKDAETNLNTFDLRQFDSRLGRWLNPDPMYQYNNPYIGMGNNPVSFVDPSGGIDRDVQQAWWHQDGVKRHYSGDYRADAEIENEDPGWKTFEYSGGGGCGPGSGGNSGPGFGHGVDGGGIGGNWKSDEQKMKDNFNEWKFKMANEKADRDRQTKYKNLMDYMEKPYSNRGLAEPPGDGHDPKAKGKNGYVPDPNILFDRTSSMFYPGVKIYVVKGEQGKFDEFTKTIYIPETVLEHQSEESDYTMHEYGHYLQLVYFQKTYGDKYGLYLYYILIDVPSSLTQFLPIHMSQWYEINANDWAKKILKHNFFNKKIYKTS